MMMRMLLYLAWQSDRIAHAFHRHPITALLSSRFRQVAKSVLEFAMSKIKSRPITLIPVQIPPTPKP
jgi:hypothetical protein